MRFSIGVSGLAVAILMVGCGGSGTSSKPAPAPAPINRPPIASAVSNAEAAPEGGSVTLNASNSRDPDGTALTYSWTQTSGPTAQIASPSAAETTVNFGEVDLDQVVSFRLTVSDGALQDTADIDVTLQNASDTPGMDGVLTIRTKGTPVAMIGNLRSRRETNSEILFVEKDEAGNTSSVYYEIQGAGDGSISQGVPLRKTGGFQDFSSDVKFRAGYSGAGTSSRFEASFFAIEPDRVLLLRDPAYDPDTGDVNNDPSKIYEVGVELPGENACMISTGYFPDPYGRLAETGNVLIGYEDGGARLFSWPYDQPNSVSENSLDQTKSYCGAVIGIAAGGGTLGVSASLGMLDTDARILDLYLLRSPFQNRTDAVTEAPISTRFERSVDLSMAGLDPIARRVESFSNNIHIYSNGGVQGLHQALILFSEVCSIGGGDGIAAITGPSCYYPQVLDIEGTVPTDAALVLNEAGSPFYEPSIAATRFIIFMQPDMNRVAKIPFSNIAGPFSPPIYQNFSSGAHSIVRMESKIGFDRKIVITHPEEKRLTVYAWPAPPIP